MMILLINRYRLFSFSLIVCFVINSFPCFAYSVPTNINVQAEDKVYYEPKKPPEKSLEELYQDVFMMMLLPYIQKEVDNYYEKNTGYSPSVDPWMIDLLSIERPYGYRSFTFTMNLEVNPYLGAHNSIGVDHITTRVSYDKVEILKYEHVEDKPIPPWLQKNDNQAKKSLESISTSSIKQAEWESLNPQQKEFFLERLIMLSYSSQIQEVVDNYYLTQMGYDVDKIIDVKLIEPYKYEMLIQISTFAGAHNPPYGVDKVTIHFSNLCDGKIVKYEHKGKECKSESILTDLNQKVNTKSYSLKVPSKWNVKTDGVDTEFFIGDNKVGEVARFGYLVFGNHYEILEEKHLTHFSTDIFMVKLARSKPAAAKDDTITEELHFYLPSISSTGKLTFGSKDVYDIRFFTEFVRDDTALEIIKTFKYN